MQQQPNVTVEPLSLTDLVWFAEVAAVRMLEDEVKRPELVNHTQIYHLVTKGISDKAVFVAKRGEECIGAIGGILSPNVFNPQYTVLSEVFWYVLPEHRNSRAGLLLLKALEDRAKECSDELILSLLSSSPVQIKTMEKRGYALGEFSFRKTFER